MLNERALVLNRNWMAIDTCSVRRALCMLYLGVAKAVAPDTFEAHDWMSWLALRAEGGEPCIRGVTFSVRVPEVLLLVAYDRVPRKRVVFSRRNLYRRDGYRCQYCGSRPSRAELSIDHVVPRSRGGNSGWGNCVVACRRCNKRKAHRTLAESGLRLIREPREPVWGPHLTLNVGRPRGSWQRFLVLGQWDAAVEAARAAGT